MNNEEIKSFIDELLEKLQKTGLGSISVEIDNIKIEVKAKKENIIVSSNQPQTNVIQNIEPEINTNIDKPQDDITGNQVKSPIVGTFYSCSSPDKPAFAKVGDKVSKGDVLFIIESMKLMNEIKSEFDGVVKKVLIKDGEAVEFGQSIMIIE